jgi:hypothetical protein
MFPGAWNSKDDAMKKQSINKAYEKQLIITCTICIGISKLAKKPGYPILAIMNLKYSSRIMELRVPGSVSYLPSCEFKYDMFDILQELM